MDQKNEQKAPLRIKDLAELKRCIRPGTELVATSHSKHPALVGLVRVVTEVQTNAYYSVVKDQPTHQYSTCNYGKGFRSDFEKASNYLFEGTTIKVLDRRSGDNSVLYEMELYPGECLMPGQKSDTEENEGIREDDCEIKQKGMGMTLKESLLFRGAMQIEQPRMTCNVMLIASQLDHYDLFYGAGDDVQLGKFIMEQIQRPSDQAREFLDPEKVGAAYRQKGGNTFCDGHFIKVTSLIDPFLDSDPSMNPDKGDFAIRVKLASRTNMDGVWVGFPDTGEYMDAAHPDELLLALDELEAESLTECIAMEVDCCLPQLKDIPSQYDSAAQLIRHAIDFGYAWSEQGQGEPRWLDKFMAVMELEDCHRLDYALDLAQNLRCYHFMPRDMDLADYGKELAMRDGIYPKDELLAACFDAEGYANQRMKRMGLSAAEHGFVSWNGTELNFEYSQPDTGQTMQM